jgi:hypothetical protein
MAVITKQDIPVLWLALQRHTLPVNMYRTITTEELSVETGASNAVV